jgi:hypothetical protein
LATGYNVFTKKKAITPPTNCAIKNPGIDDGLIPANESDIERAKSTAGFAKLVDEVNQYAPPIHTPTA